MFQFEHIDSETISLNDKPVDIKQTISETSSLEPTTSDSQIKYTSTNYSQFITIEKPSKFPNNTFISSIYIKRCTINSTGYYSNTTN